MENPESAADCGRLPRIEADLTDVRKNKKDSKSYMSEKSGGRRTSPPVTREIYPRGHGLSAHRSPVPISIHRARSRSFKEEELCYGTPAARRAEPA